MTSQNLPVVVIGDGLAAQSAIALTLQHTSHEIVWIAGSGARVRAALPALEAGLAAQTLRAVTASLGVEIGGEQSGTFIREFRNKAFREPAWLKTPLENRAQVLPEVLWEPELAFVAVNELRFAKDLGEIEEQIWARLHSGEFARLSRVSGVPVAEIKIVDGAAVAVTLASGQEIACAQVIYADRWTGAGGSLAQIAGLPKPLSFVRRREPVGVLQVTLDHREPVGAGVLEGFFGALTRDSKSDTEMDRHFFGYFSEDGKHSHWTLCLNAEEGEDNNEIAKKYRRMKAALDKAFVGSPWIVTESSSFLATIQGEQVRFEESSVFSSGEAVRAPETLGKVSGLTFLTDGYGPSCALQQVGALFEIAVSDTDAQAVSPDSSRAPELQA